MKLAILLAGILAVSASANAETYVCKDIRGQTVDFVVQRAADGVNFYTPAYTFEFEGRQVPVEKKEFDTIAETDEYLQLVRQADDGGKGYMFVSHLNKKTLQQMSVTMYGHDMTTRKVLRNCE